MKRAQQIKRFALLINFFADTELKTKNKLLHISNETDLFLGKFQLRQRVTVRKREREREREKNIYLFHPYT